MLRDSIDAADLVGVLLLICVLLVVAFFMRRAAIRRGVASLECSLNWGRGTVRGWHLGLARYTGDDMQWFRLFSLSPQPKLTFSRRGVRIRGRRMPRRHEVLAVTAGAVILQCDVAGLDGRLRPVELAMSESGATGFLAWVESAPPGTHTHPDARRA